jgi:hypothetical protein
LFSGEFSSRCGLKPLALAAAFFGAAPINARPTYFRAIKVSWPLPGHCATPPIRKEPTELDSRSVQQPAVESKGSFVRVHTARSAPRAVTSGGERGYTRLNRMTRSGP